MINRDPMSESKDGGYKGGEDKKSFSYGEDEETTKFRKEG